MTIEVDGKEWPEGDYPLQMSKIADGTLMQHVIRSRRVAGSVVQTIGPERNLTEHQDGWFVLLGKSTVREIAPGETITVAGHTLSGLPKRRG